MTKMQMFLSRKRNQDRAWLQNSEPHEYTEQKLDTPERGPGMQPVDHLVDRLLVICQGKEIKRFAQCCGVFTDEICNNHGETYHQKHAEAHNLDPDCANPSDRLSGSIAVNRPLPSPHDVKH